MERLTFEGNFCDIAQCRDSACKQDGTCTQKEVWKRLKAYEDTGLEPEAIETVKLALAAKHLVDLETLNNTPISRLVELAEADKDGHVVVLPCKLGVDMVNRILPEQPFPMENVRLSITYYSRGRMYNMSLRTFEGAVKTGKIVVAGTDTEKAMEAMKDG